MSTTDTARKVRASALGYAPIATALPDGILLGPSQQAGFGELLRHLRQRRTQSTTGEDGVALDGELMFQAPIDAPIGVYRWTLTLTLMSQ